MKRVFSYVIAGILMLNILSINAFATEEAIPSIDQVTQLGCEVFPEYADRILASRSLVVPRDVQQEKITIEYQETRKTSDNSSATYIELSNGEVLLASSNYTINDSFQALPDNGSIINTYNFTITRYSSAGTFALNGFTARVYPSGYDKIVSAGSVQTNPGCVATRTTYRPNETASSYAKLVYNMLFVSGQSGTLAFEGDFIIDVGGNNISYYVNDYGA